MSDMHRQSFFSSSIWIAVTLAVITVMVFAPVLLFGSQTFLTNLDNVDQTFSWYQKLSSSIHSGYLPIWNANVYGGSSFAGELQTGVLYPVNIVWVWLFGNASGISEQAINWLVAVHFWIAAFGCYLLLRELRVRAWAALLGGVVFAFSGAVAFRAISQTVIFFGLAFMPLALYFLAHYHNTLKKRWLIWSGACLGIMLLVGHIQPFFHTLLAALLFELAWIHTRKGIAWRSCIVGAKNLGIVCLSACIIALPQLWVSAPYLSHAYRIQVAGYAGPGEKISYAAFSKAFNIDVHEFANLIDPVTYPIRDGNNIFIGLVPLVCIVIALWFGSKQLKASETWKKYALFIKALFVVSVIAMLGYATWFAVVLYELPFVYQIRQLGRYAVLFDLALVMLFALSLIPLTLVEFTKKQARIMLAIGAFLLVNAVYLFALREHIFGLHFALQTLLVAVLLILLPFIKAPQKRSILLGALLLMTVCVNTLWYLPKVKADTRTPAAYNLPTELIDVIERTDGQYRLEDIDGALPVNLGNVYKVQTTGGYSATMYDAYYRLRHTSGLPNSFVQDILGVELIATKQMPPEHEILYSDPTKSLYIVRRSSALPKMFISDVNGSTNRNDYHGIEVYTEEYDDHYQKYEVNLERGSRVIISEMAYPGWAAKVDGKKVDLHSYAFGGYEIFKSLDIPQGKHTVELLYKPFVVF